MPYCVTTEIQLTIFYFSALYVVDLKRFRRVAAGDRLRGQYQGLSQDPNSLSNLDQVSDTEFKCKFKNVLYRWLSARLQ